MAKFFPYPEICNKRLRLQKKNNSKTSTTKDKKIFSNLDKKRLGLELQELLGGQLPTLMEDLEFLHSTNATVIKAEKIIAISLAIIALKINFNITDKEEK